MDYTTEITALPRIGPARAVQFARLGIHTLYDLVTFFPRSYEDRTKFVRLSELQVDEPACFRAMVVRQPKTAQIRRGLTITQLTVADDTAQLRLTFFNYPYAAQALEYGREYRFYGVLKGDFTGYAMQNPQFEPLEGPQLVTGRILPVYSRTAGLPASLLRSTVNRALEICLPTLPEVLPEAVLQTYDLCSAREAYQCIHNPPDFDQLARARRRVVFEEFFLFSAGLLYLRQSRNKTPATAFTVLELSPFLEKLPYAPTGAQRRAMDDIRADLGRGEAMRRLLQGDVGSGKTLVAAAAAYLTVENGFQAAIMAPTEILAEQHFHSLSALFAPFSLVPVLLTGSTPAAEKRRIKAGLAEGSIALVVGTHALLTEDVTFGRLGLVVADEQHRFGVQQRAALRAKGESPHLLVMSATPIPRTLALMIYGDLDVSLLDELPPGRQQVDTFLVDETMRPRINAFIRKQAAAGHQVYVVCPAVEESELESLKSAEVWAETLQKAVFPELRVGLLHGKLRPAEKEQVMADFAAHKLDVLVATTVIEVGVDVPNATLIVIENADRFGLSQLHQLRGRVGRGRDKSYCVLFSSNHSAEARQRLKTLVKSCDGFAIAEADLSQRGPGDFFGSRQHGLPPFKAASLIENMALIRDAQTAAQATMARTDLEEDPCHTALFARIERLFAAGQGGLD